MIGLVTQTAYFSTMTQFGGIEELTIVEARIYNIVRLGEEVGSSCSR